MGMTYFEWKAKSVIFTEQWQHDVMLLLRLMLRATNKQAEKALKTELTEYVPVNADCKGKQALTPKQKIFEVKETKAKTVYLPTMTEQRSQGTAKHKDTSKEKPVTKHIYKRFVSEGGKIGLSKNVLFCCVKWYKRALREDYREVLTLAYEIYQANNCNEKGACITLKAMALNRIERNKAGASVDDLTALIDLSINTNRHIKKNVLIQSLDAMIKPIGNTPTDDDTTETTELDTKAMEATQTSGISWRYRAQAHEIAETAYAYDKSFSVPLSFNSSTAEGKRNQRKARKICAYIRESYPDVERLTPISMNHLVQLYAQGAI